MKKILVPTDFSSGADNALMFAIALAKEINGEIILVHAYDIKYASSYVPFDRIADEIKQAKKESDRKLREMVYKLEDQAKIACHVLSERLPVTEAILNACKEMNADAIVMGTKGISNLSTQLMGTVTSEIIGKAECPVFAIPPDSHFKGIRHLVFATDYRGGDVHVLDKVIDLFRPLRTRMTLVHVTDEEEEKPEELMAEFTRNVIQKTCIAGIEHNVLPPGNTEELLEAFIRKNAVDLLVVSPGKHSLFGKLFGRSLSRKMAFHSDVPVLAVG